MTDALKHTLGEHDYYPYGVTPTKAYQEELNPGTPHIDPMRYAGHQRDFLGYLNIENTDYLDYMHARYYDPKLGRFLSVDPLRAATVNQPKTWNKYAYALSNPLAYTDPTGMAPCMMSDPAVNGGSLFISECITVEAKADRVDYLSDFFFEFLFEDGPEQRLYDDDDFQTEDIARSPGAAEMRDRFVKLGCQSSSLNPNLYPGSYDSMVAYRETLANGSFVNNPVASQVGGFSYRFDRLPDGRVMYTAANQLSAYSLLYHMPGIPHKGRGGPVPFMGNVDERFRWIEDVPPDCP